MQSDALQTNRSEFIRSWGLAHACHFDINKVTEHVKVSILQAYSNHKLGGQLTYVFFKYCHA